MRAGGSVLRPAGALAHPVWWLALVVLVLNDHVFKGSGHLAVVTGKLSDFAGLIVAPSLFAVVVLARSRLGVALCHAAVGVVFAGIQVSSVCAQEWSSLMAAVGFPWRITSDVTDLVGLLALGVSWRLLVPAMERPVVGNLRRATRTVGVASGLFCCLATSRFEEDNRWWWDFEGDVYLHNATADVQPVRVMTLDVAVLLDCDVVRADPGRLLDERLFVVVGTTEVEPGRNIPVRAGFAEDRECHASRIDVDGLPTALLFWNDGSPPFRVVPGSYDEDDDKRSGRVEIREDGDRLVYEAEPESLLHDVQPPGSGCAPQPDGDRVDWSGQPEGRGRLRGIEVGVDGCIDVDATDYQFYLCIPPEAFVFDLGDEINVVVSGASAQLPENVLIERVGPDGLPTADVLELLVTRGEKTPKKWGLSFIPIEDATCAPMPDECGTVASPMQVEITSSIDNARLQPAGAPVTIAAEQGATATGWLVHGQQRHVLDPRCSMGPELLTADLELVLVYDRPEGM